MSEILWNKSVPAELTRRRGYLSGKLLPLRVESTIMQPREWAAIVNTLRLRRRKENDDLRTCPSVDYHVYTGSEC